MSTIPSPIRELLSRKRTDVRKAQASVTQAFYPERGWVSFPGYPVRATVIDMLGRGGATVVAVTYTVRGVVSVADFTVRECAA